MRLLSFDEALENTGFKFRSCYAVDECNLHGVDLSNLGELDLITPRSSATRKWGCWRSQRVSETDFELDILQTEFRQNELQNLHTSWDVAPPAKGRLRCANIFFLPS